MSCQSLAWTRSTTNFQNLTTSLKLIHVPAVINKYQSLCHRVKSICHRISRCFNKTVKNGTPSYSCCRSLCFNWVTTRYDKILFYFPQRDHYSVYTGHCMILYFLFQRCLLWSEVSLNEALTRYQNASVSDVREDWFRTLKLLFSGLNTWATFLICYYHQPTKFCRKVMFSASVCLSFCSGRGGVPFDHYLWCIGSHYTGTCSPRHVQTCSTWTSLYRHLPLPYRAPPPASDIWWPRLETCSNLFTSFYQYSQLVTGRDKQAVRILLGCFAVLNMIGTWSRCLSLISRHLW